MCGLTSFELAAIVHEIDDEIVQRAINRRMCDSVVGMNFVTPAMHSIALSSFAIFHVLYQLPT